MSRSSLAPRRRFAGALTLSFALALAALHTDAARAEPAPGSSLPSVPYVPTPQPVVDRMLAMAQVGKDDVVYDLGCGDGRIVVTAARMHGARGVGIDLNPDRIREAEENARAAGVEHQVRLVVGDLFETDFSEATVVALYLLTEVNLALRPILWKQLKVGTRIVSHVFGMGADWPPERTDIVDGREVYFWTIRPEHK